MNQQPDKIFREKLEHYQRNAPTPAWDRIEADLDKKERSVWPWLRAAAAVLLLALGAWIFWPSHNALDQTKHTAEQKNTTNPKTNPTTPKETPVEQQSTKALVPTEQKSQQQGATENKRNTLPRKREEKQSLPTASHTNMEKIQTANNEHAVGPLPTVEQGETTSSSQAVVNVEEAQNIKLVYTASVSEKYLKKTVSDEATSDEKKTSRLQRLLDKAEDLTTNQDPIGDLRQAKNEILALNFRSEKDRGQNK